VAKPKAELEPASGKVRGRPRIELDLKVVEGLGSIGATAAEMAQILPASQSTIEHRLADRTSEEYRAYARGRARLNTSLRRKQVEVAMSGNVTMLIWLGKQLLFQQDRHAFRVLDLSTLTDEQIQRLAAGEDLEDVVSAPYFPTSF